MESDVAERFWGKVSKSDGCWEWTGRRYYDGYGEFTVSRSRRTVAHRMAWILANGREPLQGMQICHRCDNPPCVNPAHLFEGTARDNVQDMITKGRDVPPPKLGAREALAKITPTQVVEIRQRCAETADSYVKIAAEYHLKETTIRDIATGRLWTDLPGPRTPVGSRKKGRPKRQITDGMGYCPGCKAEKSLEDFPPSVAAKRYGWCRACYREWDSVRRTL